MFLSNKDFSEQNLWTSLDARFYSRPRQGRELRGHLSPNGGGVFVLKHREENPTGSEEELMVSDVCVIQSFFAVEGTIF